MMMRLKRATPGSYSGLSTTTWAACALSADNGGSASRVSTSLVYAAGTDAGATIVNL
jgi:hypothetical protein